MLAARTAAATVRRIALTNTTLRPASTATRRYTPLTLRSFSSSSSATPVSSPQQPQQPETAAPSSSSSSEGSGSSSSSDAGSGSSSSSSSKDELKALEDKPNPFRLMVPLLLGSWMVKWMMDAVEERRARDRSLLDEWIEGQPREIQPQAAKHIRGDKKKKNQLVETPASVSASSSASSPTTSSAAPSAPATPATPAPVTPASSRTAAIQAVTLALLPSSSSSSSSSPTLGTAAASSTTTEGEEPSPSHADHKSCRACREGSEEAELNAFNQATAASAAAAASPSSAASSSASSSASAAAAAAPCAPCFAYSHSLCPLNRAEVGRASWGYLHTLAAYYPDRPSERQRGDMVQLVKLFMKTYPCAYCADRSIEQLEREPIEKYVGSQGEFAGWMCRAHNEVNERLGKPIFDCNFVNQRWRDGPPTGECD